MLEKTLFAELERWSYVVGEHFIFKEQTESRISSTYFDMLFSLDIPMHESITGRFVEITTYESISEMIWSGKLLFCSDFGGTLELLCFQKVGQKCE